MLTFARFISISYIRFPQRNPVKTLALSNAVKDAGGMFRIYVRLGLKP
jgi:hypothetical protein